ncbi:MAG: hypothetical protein WC533_02620 [Candidatus Pacearchaeota archaeon]
MVKKKGSINHAEKPQNIIHSADARRIEMDKLLVENFVTLQRVLTNLSKKFDELSDNLTRMINLFEISAKTFIDKHGSAGITKEEKEFIDKLDKLLEQNKIIAKGLTLMEERVRGHPLQQPQINTLPQYPPANPAGHLPQPAAQRTNMFPSIKQDNINKS